MWSGDVVDSDTYSRILSPLLVTKSNKYLPDILTTTLNKTED